VDEDLGIDFGDGLVCWHAGEATLRRPALARRGRFRALPGRRRAAIRDVLIPARLLGLFLILVGGGVGLPIPEDLTLLGAGVLANRRILRLRDVIAVGFAQHWLLLAGLVGLGLYLALRAWALRSGLGADDPITRAGRPPDEAAPPPSPRPPRDRLP